MEQNFGDNGGSGLGYAGISASAAIEFNIYSGNNHTQGTNFATNGSIGNYNSTGDVAFWFGHEIYVDLSYDGSVLTDTLTDLANGATYSASYATDLQQIVGSDIAYVGFSGASGLATATQTVSDFVFNGDAGGTFHWTNSSGGNWTDPGSWDQGAVPQAGDHAVIDAPGIYAVTTNADETVATLALNGNAARTERRAPNCEAGGPLLARSRRSIGPLSMGYCCKSRFAQGVGNSAGCRRDFRVKMRGTSSPSRETHRRLRQ